MYTNVMQFLEESYQKKANDVLLEDISNKMTYTEVYIAARKIGSFLARNIQGKNNPVFVCIDRNIDSIVMFFGVVYSGNFYVPVDLGLPEVRLKKMLETINPVAILGKEDESFEGVEASVSFFSIKQMLEADVDDKLLDNIRENAIDTDPLYAIFTSGSTGVPKAVLIAHQSVIDLMNAFDKTFSFDDHLVLGNQAPFDFDVSVKDIYSAIKFGARLEVIPKEYFVFPVKLIDYLNERKVNTVIWAVTALCIIANLRIMRKKKPEYLENVFFSGEVMPIKALNYWMDNLPMIRYVNLYGPTEITCNCTYFRVERKYETNEVLPIGKPFINTDVIVLNGNDSLVGCNEIGELCVRGRSLALGYYNNIEKTDEFFCQNPLNDKYPEKIYRTGDLVKYDDNGNLIYCARKDFQIKHMGHRIELSEIEAAADSVPGINRCCCLYDYDREKIVLVYETITSLSELEISGYLVKLLPKYMIPTEYIKLDYIPLNNHLKIDRARLKKDYIS